MSQFAWVVFVLLLAVFLDLIVVNVWRRYNQIRQDGDVQVENPSRWRLLIQAFLLETQDGILQKPFDATIRNEKFKRGVKVVFEFCLIAAWALWVGKEYLDFDPRIVPAGREFGSSIQAHHLWTRFQSCGACALWDGSERGGFPAFVDILASSLHPAVIITTLMFGVVNGAKVMVIVSLWIAGFAQWWLGRVLGLNWLARMWGAFMVIVAGHLAGRMELGIVSLILSTAMVSMTFAPAIDVAKTGSKRSAVLLGVVLALVAVAGQGYMQVGLLVMAPAYLILIIRSKLGWGLLLKRYLLAAGLGFLLASPFIVPFLHFFPNFSKGSDPSFSAGQPLSYYLLNLFIDDREFFYNTSLGKLPYPNMYVMFVGWIPVILALLSLWMNKKEDRRWLVFLAVCATLVLFVGSTLPLQWIKGVFPGVTTLRFITMIGGLAVPAILALAAYTLNQLLQLKWPRLTLLFADEVTSRYKGVSLSLILLVPLIFALQQAYSFSQTWLYTDRLGDGILQLLTRIETPDLQWVQPPFGEHIYIEPAVRNRMKLSPGIMTWRWKGRDFPRPVFEANRKGAPPGPYKQVDEIYGVPIYMQSEQSYAQVSRNGKVFPCSAQGLGGYISVECEIKKPGKLVVQENMYSGWKAWMDGERISLAGDRWLVVDAPQGLHTFEFRYQPWDVLLGMVFCLIGLAACFWIWRPSTKGSK